ncbi:hypothetical protein Tco_1389762 [Tanacetum coccineum]
MVVKICSGVIWGKYCGAKGNWPDGNWPDGNWEELPVEFCEDGVDGRFVRASFGKSIVEQKGIGRRIGRMHKGIGRMRIGQMGIGRSFR